MSVNTELVGKILQSIADHPDKHDQRTWIQTARIDVEGLTSFELNDFENDCGTSCCIAGWTLLHDGFEFQVNSEWDKEWKEYEYQTSVVKDGEQFMDFEYPHVAAYLIVGGDGQLKSEITKSIFHEMDRNRAIAKLTFLYFNEILPREDLEGMTHDQFVEKWYGKFTETFTPKEKS